MAMNGWTPIKQAYTSWGTQFTGKWDKLFAYGLALLLLFFSTLDVIIDWSNYTDLKTDDFQYGLVVGPPKPVALTSIFVFCIIGSILYALEVANVLTLMCNGGHVRIPMEVEQSLVLILEEIPLAAANLGIVMCRYDIITPTQTTTQVTALLSTTMRMYFYGWAKEYQFKYERSTYRVTLKVALYVTASVVWIMLFLVCCFTWNHARLSSAEFATQELKLKLMNGTSVFLIKMPEEDPFGKYGKVRNWSLTDMDSVEDVENNWLVRDLDNVIKAAGQKAMRTYSCTKGDPSRKIPICHRHNTKEVKFLFYYRNKSFMTSRSPFGELKYNYAPVKTNGTCVYQTEDLPPDWFLYFLVPDLGGYYTDADLFNSTRPPAAIQATTPWGNRTCVIAKPRFDRHLNPCTSSVGLQ